MVTKVYTSDDSYVDTSNPDTNYGTDYYTYVALNGGKQAFYDFDLSSTNPFTYVSSRVMIKPASSSLVSDIDYSLIQTNWSEGTVTWNTKPTFSAVPLGNIQVDGTGNADIVPIDSTQYVAGNISGDFTYYGYAFIGGTYVSGTGSEQGFLTMQSTPLLYPYIEVTTHSDIDYYLEKNVLIRQIDTYMCGNSKANVASYDFGNNEVLLDIRMPWDNTYDTDVFFAVDDIETYTNVESTYTEYYLIKFHGIFSDGEGNYAGTTLWWYRDYGDVYVSTSGNDSDLGISWDSAYRTFTKGMTDVSIDRTMFIEGGTYASETSPEPVRDCKMQIKSSSGDVILDIN